MTTPPATRLTSNLRAIWEALNLLGADVPPWEQWYAGRCQQPGGTANGCAIAAVIFDRARRLYWPEYFSPADTPAVHAWGELIDRRIPLVTPDVAEQAVDAVHAAGITQPGFSDFAEAAENLMRKVC